MGWMWVLLAVLVVLVAAGVLVSRRRGGTVEGGPEATGTPDTAEVPDGPGPGRDPGTVALFDTAGVVDPSAAAAGSHAPSPDVAPQPSSADGAEEWSGPGATAGGPTGTSDAPAGHGLSDGTEDDPAPGTRPPDVASGATATAPDPSGPEVSDRGAAGDGADGDVVTAGGTGPGGGYRPTSDGAVALSQDGAAHDGAAHDGTAPDGTAPDGTAHEGVAQVGVAQVGAVQNGAAHDGPVDDSAAGPVPIPGEPGSAATAPEVPLPRPESDPASPEGSAEDDEPAGRHALRDDVEPAPLPGPDPAPADDGPPAPLPIPSRPRQGAGGSALAALDSMIIGPSAASAPLPPGVRPGPYPDSVLAPTDGGDPPETHRVKVHSGSRRFHPPESPYYVRTRADLYFTAEGAARAAGFIAWHERPGAR
ncbi:hypothetical protein GCM10009772_31880 [Pseudonocardia alni subsp. carboxydivorans]|uniref:Uncharacterized protein n=1 Tax=Pseudonocardia alni subsp. carboxydivorans TaxID=415010 RepID=A0ABU9A7T1_PSEA5